MSDQQTIEWLRGLAERGGKGVVNNIDARCLGRIADDLERLRAEADHWSGLVSRADRALFPFQPGIPVGRASDPQIDGASK